MSIEKMESAEAVDGNEFIAASLSWFYRKRYRVYYDVFGQTS